MPPTLRLFVDTQFASPYAMSVFVALQEKRLEFEISTVDLAAQAQMQPYFAALSLTRRVPVLVHQDFALTESSAIAEYLDEIFPGVRLFPADPRHRARARQVQAWLRSDLLPIRSERSTEVLFYGPNEAPLSPAARVAADKLFAAADGLLSPGNQHLFDEWCLADLDLALMLNRLVLNGDAVPERLSSYARSQWQRPSAQAWVQRQRPPR